MQSHKYYKKSVSAILSIAALCLLSFQTAAQQSGPQSKQGTVSDDNFIKLHQQIKELKNPAFRAFLRIRLLSSSSPEPSPVRRQAAMDVATQGVADLCEHQDEIWRPTASWLHGGFVKQIKSLQSSEETALEICVLRTETRNDSANDLSSGIKMLSNPETRAAGIDLAKVSIQSGQVPANEMLAHLVHLKAAKSPQISELLRAVLILEEKQPGTLPLNLMPFFSSLFLDKSVPPAILTRFVSVAVRSTRLSAEELANPIVRSSVSELLNGLAGPAKQFAPELYPEIAGRLSSLNGSAPNKTETRLAAEERIRNASDQLEQIISEANSAPDEGLKTLYLFRAARMAKEQGQFVKAVDLALKITTDRESDSNDNKPSWLNDFLTETVSLAIKKKSPGDAAYAISKMPQRLGKARAFRLLGEYYGSTQDKTRSKEAFTQSAKLLKAVDNSNEKVRASLTLAESVLKYEPVDAYEVFRESVKAINNLPSPENDQENKYYLNLFPVAEKLISSFRLLATHENQTATSLAAEIKLSELRLAALSGAYSGHDVIADAKFHQE